MRIEIVEPEENHRDGLAKQTVRQGAGPVKNITNNLADPYFDGGVRGWIMNTARQHYWKVASWYEFEDLLQEGYLCYAKCRARFVPVDGGDEPTHDDRKRFMAYFQMAFMNCITDLQQHPRSKLKEVVYAALPAEQADGIEAWAAHASELSDASVAVLLAQAPAEIMEILKLILLDGAATGPYLRSRLRKKVLPGATIPRIVKGRRRLRETTEEYYDRCLGRTGVIAQLREYFLGEEAQSAGMV